MSRSIHFRVEGDTEKFLEEMKKMGLSERDVFAKALGLLNLVHKTGRVAFLRSDVELNKYAEKYADELIDFVFTLDELEPASKKESSKPQRPKPINSYKADDDDIEISNEP